MQGGALLHGTLAGGGRAIETIRVMLCFRGLRGCWVGGKGGEGGLRSQGRDPRQIPPGFLHIKRPFVAQKASWRPLALLSLIWGDALSSQSL